MQPKTKPQRQQLSTRLPDDQWERLLPFIQTHPRIYVGNEARCRKFLDAVLWILRTGAQWRTLPADRGPWNTVYRRFRDWNAKGVFADMLKYFTQDADFEWLSVDSSTIRAHVSAAGAPRSAGGQEAQNLGRSRGGFSTKLHVKVDALGNPLKLALTPGQRNDKMGWSLIREESDQESSAMLADRGYDADWIRDELAAMGVQAVIPPTKNRSVLIEYDRDLYKERHVVECFIGKIKWFRRVFSRYDKLSDVYLAFLTFASCLVWLR